MVAMIYITLSCTLLQVTYSLKITSDVNKSKESKGSRRILDISAGLQNLGNEQELESPSVYDILEQQLREYEKSHQNRNLLRAMVTAAPKADRVNTEYAELVEKELQETDAKSSLLLQNAYVQKHGQNDYLVLGTPVSDPFVTVIPNDIYYTSGNKICVNWLDECSVQGIRARLLHRVRSP